MIPNDGLGEGHDAIEFALTIDDHYDMRNFLDAWMHGDLGEWPEYIEHLKMKFEKKGVKCTTKSTEKIG